MTAEKILAKYADLLATATAICTVLYPGMNMASEFKTLSISGDKAMLDLAQPPEMPDDFIERDTAVFPLALLNVPLEGAIEWAKQERNRQLLAQDLAEKARHQALKEQEEADARAKFETLKARFEPRAAAKRVKRDRAKTKRKGKRK